MNELRDLDPKKDPKGGSPSEPKKPKSDQIRTTSFGDYIKAHSHPNGGSAWVGFFRSNLFVGLVLWIMSQAALLGGSYFLNYTRTNQLVEWKVTVDSTLKRMDDWGTIHGHYTDERQDKDITRLQTLSETESQMPQLITIQSERNNDQDKKIAALEAQMSQVVPTLVEIKAKLTFVADLLDERTKNKR